MVSPSFRHFFNLALFLLAEQLHSDTIRQIAEAYQQTENVVALRVLDNNNQVIYQSSTDERDLIIETNPITYQGQQVGLVEVSLSRQGVRTTQRSILFSILTIMLFSYPSIWRDTLLMSERLANRIETRWVSLQYSISQSSPHSVDPSPFLSPLRLILK